MLTPLGCEVNMTSSPQPPFCVICNRPIEPEGLKYVDENGNPVHKPCYVQPLTKKKPISDRYIQSKYDCFA
jgi:hypothetical protein